MVVLHRSEPSWILVSSRRFGPNFARFQQDFCKIFGNSSCRQNAVVWNINNLNSRKSQLADVWFPFDRMGWWSSADMKGYHSWFLGKPMLKSVLVTAKRCVYIYNSSSVLKRNFTVLSFWGYCKPSSFTFSGFPFASHRFWWGAFALAVGCKGAA